MTVWKPIPLPHVANRFQAADAGVIRTLAYETAPFIGRHGLITTRKMPSRYLQPRIASGSPSMGKHPVVGIYQGIGRGNYRAREMRIARLVAAAFLGVPYDATNQREIQRWRLRYLDGDILNCRADNLEWTFNAGEDGSEGATRDRYARNLDGWRGTDAGSVLSRLYAETA